MPTNYNSANISGSNIAVNSPQITLPYIWDSALNGGAGAWRPGQGGDAGVSGHTIEASNSISGVSTTSSIALNTSEGVHYKHGYLLNMTIDGGAIGFQARFKVQGSMDNSNWVDLEVNDLTGTANSGVAYYDEWNYNYSRADFSVYPSAAVVGTFDLRERHDL
jgi:hypothetical protein